jgi:5-methylcytosine-specific restriction protein A
MHFRKSSRANGASSSTRSVIFAAFRSSQRSRRIKSFRAARRRRRSRLARRCYTPDAAGDRRRSAEAKNSESRAKTREHFNRFLRKTGSSGSSQSFNSGRFRRRGSMTATASRASAIARFAYIRARRIGTQTLIKKPCALPGCAELVIRGYCAAHRRAKDTARWELLDRNRGSSRERGYDRNWEQFRKMFLARHPFCNDCRRLATEVHHLAKVKNEPALKLAGSNCMALCKSCHTKRTARGE